MHIPSANWTLSESSSQALDRSLGAVRRIDSRLVLDKISAMLAELSSDDAGVMEKP